MHSFVLYFVSFNFLCILFVLIALLFKNNQKEPCHSVYDQVGCMVFGKVRRFGISVTCPRQVDTFGILVTPDGGPSPSHNSAPRGGGVVWIIHHKWRAETTASWLNLVPRRNPHSFGKKEINKTTPKVAAFSWAYSPPLPEIVSWEEGEREAENGELRRCKIQGSGTRCHAFSQQSFHEVT